jgi:hypothetical protein
MSAAAVKTIDGQAPGYSQYVIKPVTLVLDDVADSMTANIASSTNATPIAITTSGSHNLGTGNTVVISGHLTNTAANGTWTITKTGATTFTLDTSVGNGVGGATGTVAASGVYYEPPIRLLTATGAGNVVVTLHGSDTATSAQKVTLVIGAGDINDCQGLSSFAIRKVWLTSTTATGLKAFV